MSEKNHECLKETVLKDLLQLQAKREKQLEKESDSTYNHGYVAGEVSGIKKAIDLLNGYRNR